MKFITSEKIDGFLEKHTVQWVLAHYGRYRIAPGFTVADYVKLGEFYSTGVRSDEKRRDVQIHEPA